MKPYYAHMLIATALELDLLAMQEQDKDSKANAQPAKVVEVEEKGGKKEAKAITKDGEQIYIGFGKEYEFCPSSSVIQIKDLLDRPALPCKVSHKSNFSSCFLLE